MINIFIFISSIILLGLVLSVLQPVSTTAPLTTSTGIDSAVSVPAYRARGRSYRSVLAAAANLTPALSVVPTFAVAAAFALVFARPPLRLLSGSLFDSPVRHISFQAETNAARCTLRLAAKIPRENEEIRLAATFFHLLYSTNTLALGYFVASNSVKQFRLLSYPPPIVSVDRQNTTFVPTQQEIAHQRE